MVNPVHARIRLGGSLFNDARWSVGLSFAMDDGSDPFVAAGILTNATAVLEKWRDNVKALNSGQIVPPSFLRMLSTQGKIDTIRCARIGQNGRETDVALANLGTPIVGGGGPVHSAQNAIVISLQTGRPGGSYRGRVYWPALGANLSNGRVQSADTDELAGAAATWLNDVGDALSSFLTAHGQVAVVSTTQNKATPVTSCRVGNRLDSQRRRAESEKELYSVAAVPN